MSVDELETMFMTRFNLSPSERKRKVSENKKKHDEETRAVAASVSTVKTEAKGDERIQIDMIRSTRVDHTKVLQVVIKTYYYYGNSVRY